MGLGVLLLQLMTLFDHVSRLRAGGRETVFEMETGAERPVRVASP